MFTVCKHSIVEISWAQRGIRFRLIHTFYIPVHTTKYSVEMLNIPTTRVRVYEAPGSEFVLLDSA